MHICSFAIDVVVNLKDYWPIITGNKKRCQEALLFFSSFVVFQKRHRFLEKKLGGKILKPNIAYFS
jgi:hypothetical protein